MRLNRQIIIVILVLTFTRGYSQTDSIANAENSSPCKSAVNEAILDASKREYKLLSYGLPMYKDWNFERFYEEYTFEQYGIQIENGGCIVDERSLCYAKKMRELIYEEFGPDIFDKARVEAQEKYKIQTQLKIDTGYIFKHIDTLPSFVGGYDSLAAYIQRKLSHFQNQKGIIFVSFVVEKNGTISNVGIQSKPNEVLDLEIIHILNNMPKWIPGKLLGQKVRVELILPIRVDT